MKDLSTFQKIKELTHGYLSPEVYYKIYQMALDAPEGVVVDIGPAQGGSTISLGLALKENSRLKKIYSIDVFCKSAALKSYTCIEENIEVLRSNLSQFNIEQYVTPLVVFKDDTTLSHENEPISVLFIDADGAIDRDFEVYYNRLVPHGIIIIDDYKPFINIQAATRFLKWQNEGQAKNFLDSLGLSKLIDYTPLGKQYTTFKFVQYLIEAHYIELIQDLEGTVFVRKPENAKSFTEETLQELRGVRAEIEADYHRRHKAIRTYYDQIGSFIPALAKELHMEHAILFENYYYAAKQRDQTVKVYEWHTEPEAFIIDDLPLQDLSLEKIQELVTPLAQNLQIKKQVDDFQDEKIKKYLLDLKAHTLVAIPIFIESSFWGFLACWTCCQVDETLNVDEVHFTPSFKEMLNVIETSQKSIRELTIL